MTFSDASNRWGQWAAWLLATVACTMLARPACGQTDLLGADAASDAPMQLDPVRIDLESFGIGGVVRAGSWCGIRLSITEQTSERREVIVRLGLPDADGDLSEYRTVVSTNPGVRQPVTLYARIPSGFTGDPTPIVGVYEALEEGDGTGALGYREGELIAQLRLPRSPVTDSVLLAGQGAMMVVGNRTMGLDAYSDGIDSQSSYMPFGHEQARVIRGVSPDDLPDRWFGLSPYAEIIWSEGSPVGVSLDQARALREWVQRGGHLVVVLPVVGNDWLALENQELATLLPRVSIERRESQPVADYMPMLAVTPDVLLRRPITVHALDPLAEAEPREAMTILSGPDGRAVVSRRLVGVGAVTLVGLDLPGLEARRGSPSATNFVPQNSVSPGVPEADVFWHRVLGRRGALMSKAGVEQYNRRPNSAEISNRTFSWVDSDVGDEINLTGQAATGVLLGIAVFALYWLIAGPGGFFGLKSRDLTRHAWVAFVGAGLVFTGLAWGGAWAIKPKALTFDHLTFLDHVYGERLQRTRTIASVMIPAYGEASVEVGTEAELAVGGRGRYAHVVSPWEASDGTARTGGVGFPDSRGYPIDSRAPSKLTFPARSTVKQVEMEWLGGMDWQGIRPMPLEGEDFGVVRRASDATRSTLEGVLSHNLPGELTNVHVFVIERQAALEAGSQRLVPSSRTGIKRDEPAGQLLAVGSAHKLDLPWPTGEPRSLSQLTVTRPPLQPFMDGLAQRPSAGIGEFSARPTQGSLDQRLVAMSFFNQLTPPKFGTTQTRGPALMRRATSQTLDLSRWFTQPCVVVIGILEIEGKESCPTPFRVRINGQVRTPQVRGRTLVRWVYPLEELPPVFATTGTSGQGPDVGVGDPDADGP